MRAAITGATMIALLLDAPAAVVLGSPVSSTSLLAAW
jgi:hypothetical protein